jgi:hypothetical protein
MAATIGNPCDITTGSVNNTGVECSASLGVAKGLFLVAAGLTWTATDEADPVTWMKNQIHARNIFPVLQGIFDFGTTNESDVTESNPITGTSRKLRAGGITMLYTFQDGGLCLAKALKTFEGKGYRIMMVDQENKVLRRKNADGTFSGMKSNDIAAAIIFATATATFKNTVSISISQDELTKYSDLIVVKDGDITDFNGLVDVEITKAAAASTTKLKLGVRTECAHTDLVAKYGSTIADLDLYIVKNKATGATVTPTAAAVVNGIVELTGTYVSGQTYIVNGSTPAVWLANLIEGYDASGHAVEHLIP